MREFNTTGPCNPALHYTVMREALISEGLEMVSKGKFFTMFAPRQAGKTTYYRLLMARLNQAGYTAIQISFENLQNLTVTRFYKALTIYLRRALANHGVKIERTIADVLDMDEFFARLETERLVLIIDEFEGIPDDVLSEVMHTFRRIYHQKEEYVLHSLLLIGVSTMVELVVGPASPFNIANQLEIDYFTKAEVADLIDQYVTESGQPFDEAVINAIYDNTNGQPGLVCALCDYLVTKAVPNKTNSVTMAAFYSTLTHFLTRRQDKNILNIVQKARQKQAFMLKVLFGAEPIMFSIDVPDIAWLYAHGVIDEVQGYVAITVPLYAKRLIKAFSPVINGERQHYTTSAHDTFSQYLHDDGRLNINALLTAYRAYVRRRGFHAFDTENLKEGAWHYSLDGYINFFIEQLGGETYIEVPSGRGRTDILIRYREQSYIIETKIFSTVTNFKRGKGQLAVYLTTEGLAVGYYVVFSRVHTEADELYTMEMVAGKRIYTHIICTTFTPPSQGDVPPELITS